MNVKAVLRNVKKKGIVNTYKIHLKKKKSIEKTEELLKTIDAISKLPEETSISSVISKTIEITEEALLLDWDKKEGIAQITFFDTLREIEKRDGYKSEIHSFYVKERLPYVYNKNKEKPLANKIVFMERGARKSPSLNFLYNKLKKEKKYKVTLHELKKNSLPETCYYINSEKYIEDCATAKGIFICTANDLMGYFKLRKETTYIQLWHGCGAFKKVGLSTVDKKFGRSSESRIEFPDHTNYSYVTIASPEVSWVFEESMGIAKDSGIIVPTGISRTDVFFDQNYIQKCYEKIHEIIPQSNDKKIILYAPTFRGEVANAVSPDVLDIKRFYEEFGDDYVLIFKHHPSAKTVPEIPEEFRDTFVFDMTRGKGMNINELLTVADVLITDYSSVVFEYSLFERPMAFLTHDLDEYIDDRGLYYDFDEITPGPLCYNNDELIDYLKNIDSRFNKQEVIDFKNKFMSSCDGHSSERIIALIEE